MKRKKQTIWSRLLNKDVDYYLVAPNESTKPEHILYVQDGNDYLELGGFEETCEPFKEDLQSWLLVFIHPGTSEERWQSYHHQGKDFHNYIDFMYEELMPAIEKHLSVKKRGVLGDSLAANVSLNIAARKPDWWHHILLQSAAVSPEDIEVVRSIKPPVNWNVYQSVGIYEDAFISPITNECLYIYSRNKTLADVFWQKEVQLRFIETEDHHLWVSWKRDLPQALQCLFSD